MMHVMLNLGNRLVNEVYECKLSECHSPCLRRPTAVSSMDERRLWARAKWSQCQFARLPLLPNPAGDECRWVKELYQSWLQMRRRRSTTPTQSPSSRNPSDAAKKSSDPQTNRSQESRNTILGELGLCFGLRLVCSITPSLCVVYRSHT